MKPASLKVSMLLAAGLACALFPAVAEACSTCFGDPQAPVTHGLNRAILALLGCVALVQVGIVKVVWDIRKRTKDKADPVELRLVRGGK